MRLAILFYGKGKTPIVGQNGVSNCFILGMLKVNEPLNSVRRKIIKLQKEIVADPYYESIFSIHKKRPSHGYYLHAKDDIPEVRKSAFELIRSIDCTFEAVVARKIYYLFENKHRRSEAGFYADLLPRLLKKRLGKYDRIVLNVSERHRCTTQNNLQKGLDKALILSRFRNTERIRNCKVVFNVQQPTKEPLLSIVDYFCWSVQRAFEMGETRFYEFIHDKISVVWDIYDFAGAINGQNYYTKKHKLTEGNCLKEKSPQMH